MMKIFGIGLSRTGTTTLSKTLKMTGFNVIHYPSESDLYSFGNNGACDIPVIPNYKHMTAFWPDAKFIYTTRDKEEWLDSIVPYFERKRQWNQSGRQVDIRTKVYGTPFPNREEASIAYDKHDIDVRHFFDRDENFLELNIIGGDKPKKLFDFLGVANILNEFPHENKLKD